MNGDLRLYRRLVPNAQPSPDLPSPDQPIEPIRQSRWARPVGSTEIVLIRHGESEPYHPDRPFPVVDGCGDPALAPEGQSQAQLVGAALRHEPFDALIVSSLRRTHQTAAPLAAHLGLVPEIEPNLREVYLGEWDGGLFRLKMHQGTDPIAHEFLKSGGDWGLIPGAETTDELRDRVVGALHGVAARHRDQLIACVVHGGVIASLLAHATDVKPAVFGFAENGSISRVLFQDGAIRMRSFNEIAHLR